MDHEKERNIRMNRDVAFCAGWSSRTVTFVFFNLVVVYLCDNNIPFRILFAELTPEIEYQPHQKRRTDGKQ